MNNDIVKNPVCNEEEDFSYQKILEKANFDNAIEISSKINEVIDQNQSLYAQIRQISQDNIELKNKLNIEISKNNELKQSNKKLNENMIFQLHNKEETYKKEINKIKKKFNLEMQKLSQDFNKAIKENQNLNTQIKEFIAKEHRNLEAISFYFDHEITSFDDLIDSISKFFKQDTIIKSPKNKPVQQNEKLKQSAKDDEMKRKYKLLSSKLKEKESEIKQLQMKFDVQKNNVKDFEVNSAKILSLTRKLESTEEDKKLQEEDYQHQIKLLNLKIENLKTEILRLKNNSNSTQINLVQTPIKQEILNNFSPKKDELKQNDDSTYEELNARVKELSSELENVNKERQKLIEKIQITENEFENYKINTLKQENDLKSLSAIHEETLNELESLRDALHSLNIKKQKKGVKAIRKIEEEANSKLEKAQTIADNYKQQINEYQITITQLNEKINLLNLRNTEVVKENDNLSKKLMEYQEKLDAEVAKSADIVSKQDKEAIPISSWCFNGFDKKLSNKIEFIGRNENLQTSSKIQTAFNTIAKFYNKRIKILNDESSALNQQLEFVKDRFSKFIVDLSIVVIGKSTSLDEILSNNGQYLINQVNSLKIDHDTLSRQVKELSIKLFKVNKLFGKESPKKFKQRTEKLINEMHTKIDRLERKYKKYKSSFCSLKSSKENDDIEMKANLEKLTAENNQFKSDLQDLTKTNSELKSQNQELNSNLRNAEHKLDEESTKHKQEVAELNNQHEADKSKHMKDMSAEIKRVTEQLKQSSNNCDDSKAQISRMKNVIAAQKATIEQISADREYQKKVNEITLNSQEKKFQVEKKQITESYESTIKNLKDQISQLNRDIIKLSSKE
ncbi:hypothetical protein TVAG_404910 [Trichomonas vaginalis G3]|uniref:Uncharacterized protein n=1 Tax=Trichomonas vaginalis (strain ATCC PRA-98 / G3) TaxID=412133 RepID=A2E309_TRIV3|nr:biological adhesion protein [Trichomonas vaginalis G3]EAY12945.1 hypothetical protein TVAG_404910 [Trichomonas vaginalis G3]KAI5499757.1 biological adhesion protein [Trichomonas vaginalis G3]|eukprot:XP_001325168.1 hypothetical protein [Trichomonas vaginalis G3]